MGVARPVPSGTSGAMVTATIARAVLAPRAPAIDGRDEDEVWRLAAPISEFLEFEPNEGKPPPVPDRGAGGLRRAKFLRVRAGLRR